MNEPVKACPLCHAPMPEGSTSSLCAKCLLQVGFETDPGPASDSESRAYQPTFIAPTIDELAPHFPQLEILEQIGHGGMGVVYKARQTELDRIVALKILRPNISNDASFAERFQREARALAKLNHPNIVTIYDFGRKDGLFFFIMEYVDGTNLRHVERSGQLSPQEALSIVPQVCSALQYAHDHGVVHRDIKPENILITKSGDVRIADFGLAKLAGVADDAPLTGTWQVMGTPHYMAPEQFEKPTTVDHRADIYSLGVVIYELLTGELPIGRFRLPSEKVRVDVRLDEVVLRSLDKEPDRRYQRITDVATAVSSASGKSPSTLSADGQSRLHDFKSWITQAASVTLEHVGRVLDKVRPPEKYRELSATILMWVCTLNLCVALWCMTRRPYSDTVMFMAFMEAAAACIAFWFAREYRRGTVTSPLWWLAVCSLPWVAAGFVLSLARVVLTVLLLRNSSDSQPEIAAKSEGDSPAPDVLDRASKLMSRGWQTLTVRNVMLTVFGIGGWLGICLATTSVVEFAWARNFFPSNTLIQDLTATNVIPVSDEYQRLDISAFRVTETHGLRIDRIPLSHDSLRLAILGPESHQSVLTVDLSSFHYTIDSRHSRIDQSRIFKRDVIADWMTKADVDISEPQVQAEIDNLFELVRLMQETRGRASSLSKNLARELPTLESAVTSLMRHRADLVGDLIPIGVLLKADSFINPSRRVTPYYMIKGRPWASITYGMVAAFIGLAGLLRVCRVLYTHIWLPSVAVEGTVGPEAALESGGKQWRNCRRALIAWAIVSSGLVLVGYLVSLYAWNESVAILGQQRVSMPVRPREIISGFYLSAAVLISVFAMAARPILGRFGWWLGFATGGLAVMTLPMNLLTFPSGLAAWILMTDPAVRQLFRADAKSNSGDEMP